MLSASSLDQSIRNNQKADTTNVMNGFSILLLNIHNLVLGTIMFKRYGLWYIPGTVQIARGSYHVSPLCLRVYLFEKDTARSISFERYMRTFDGSCSASAQINQIGTGALDGAVAFEISAHFSSPTNTSEVLLSQGMSVLLKIFTRRAMFLFPFCSSLS